MAYPLWRGREKLSVGILTGREKKTIRARRMGYGLTEADPAVIGSEANNSEPIETDLPVMGLCSNIKILAEQTCTASPGG